MREIAGMTDLQMAWVYFRPRDKYDRLKRKGRHRNGKYKAPKSGKWQQCSWEDMYKRVWLERGISLQEVETRWQAKLAASASLRAHVSKMRGG